MTENLISGPPRPDGPEYVVTPDGVYIWNDGSMLSGWVKCNDIAGLCRYADTFGKVDEAVTYKYSKIPFRLFESILGTIQCGPKYEVGFVLYYRTDDNRWLVDVPDQNGKPWHVDFDGQPREDGFVVCGSVHTHPNLAARWSGGDIMSHSANCGLHFVVGTHTGSKRNQITSVLASVFTPYAHFDMPLDFVVSGWERRANRMLAYAKPNEAWLKTLNKKKE